MKSPTTTRKTTPEQEVDRLNALYGQGAGRVYQHKEGNQYTFEEAGFLKCPRTGVWFIAVFYRGGVNRRIHSTTIQRWRSAFREVGP
jgi:hypothetical protein